MSYGRVSGGRDSFKPTPSKAAAPARDDTDCAPRARDGCAMDGRRYPPIASRIDGSANHIPSSTSRLCMNTPRRGITKENAVEMACKGAAAKAEAVRARRSKKSEEEAVLRKGVEVLLAAPAGQPPSALPQRSLSGARADCGRGRDCDRSACPPRDRYVSHVDSCVLGKHVPRDQTGSRATNRRATSRTRGSHLPSVGP